MPQPRLSPRPARHCTWSAFCPGGTSSMPVRENTSERAGLRSAHPVSRLQPWIGVAKARDFSRAAPLSTGETDSPLEESGFELVVPPSFSQLAAQAERPLSISAAGEPVPFWSSKANDMWSPWRRRRPSPRISTLDETDGVRSRMFRFLPGSGPSRDRYATSCARGSG